MKDNIIPFMKPDITQADIDEVIDTLKSGWITTGFKTKQFEQELSKYCNANKTACLNSATSCLKILLKLFDIGKGDEVITTPYTFASTANEILHSGAKLVFVDIKNDFNMDPDKLDKAITKKTKAIIPTDIGGLPCDYDELKEVISKNKHKFNPDKSTLQKYLDRALLISDSAHALGATYKNKKIGSIADFTIFSFHATKNLTTAEGGAITFNSINELGHDEIYKKIMLLSLHGQDKDAYDKLKLGGWKYKIELAGFKCNLPDLSSALGLSQLKRYDNEIIYKRKVLFEIYISELTKNQEFIIPEYKNNIKETSYHLFLLRIKNRSEKQRDEIIDKLSKHNITANVHFIPLTLQPLYIRLGYKSNNFPNSYEMYRNEISLPLYTQLGKNNVLLICNRLNEIIT